MLKGFVTFATIYDFTDGSIDQIGESVHMKIVDDLTLVVATARARTPEFLDANLHVFNKFFHNFLMNKNVVWRNACLTRVREFSKAELLDCVCHITGGVDDSRTFATEFQNTLSQIFGGNTCDNLADLC